MKEGRGYTLLYTYAPLAKVRGREKKPNETYNNKDTRWLLILFTTLNYTLSVMRGARAHTCELFEWIETILSCIYMCVSSAILELIPAIYSEFPFFLHFRMRCVDLRITCMRFGRFNHHCVLFYSPENRKRKLLIRLHWLFNVHNMDNNRVTTYPNVQEKKALKKWSDEN